MLAKLLLWVCLLSLNPDIHWREGTALVMLARLLLWVCLLFESRYTLKGRYNIGNVGKPASMSMLTLFESRYTLKGRYSIGNVGKTASMSMLTLFESRYTLKGRYVIGNVGKPAFYEYAYSLWIKIYIEGKVQHLVMLAKLLLWLCLLTLKWDTILKQATIHNSQRKHCKCLANLFHLVCIFSEFLWISLKW